MSTEQLTNEILALPIADRLEVAQVLWESIGRDLGSQPEDEDRALAALARQRSAELTSGLVTPRTHEEVMERARQRFGCG